MIKRLQTDKALVLMFYCLFTPINDEGGHDTFMKDLFHVFLIRLCTLIKSFDSGNANETFPYASIVEIKIN